MPPCNSKQPDLPVRGKGWKLAADGEIGLKGRIPSATMGGMKARGFPGGAAGVYQAVEAVTQLRGQAEVEPGSECGDSLDPVTRWAGIYRGHSRLAGVGLETMGHKLSSYGPWSFYTEMGIVNAARICSSKQ